MSYSPLIQAKRSNVVHIRSKEATENTTGYNTDLTVILKNSIACAENEELHISVMSMEFPYSFYNVSAELENNTLVYDTTNSLIFESQNYNIDDIVDYFNNNTSFSALFETTYDRKKNKITFTNNDSNNPHTINFGSSTINKVIGWDEEQTDITVSASGSTTSTNVANLCTVHSILVRSNLSNANIQSSRNANSTILQKVSVDMNSGFMIYLNNSDFRQISIVQSQNIDIINLLFTNQDDKLIQTNNVNFEISLLFEVFDINKSGSRRALIEPQRKQVIATQPEMVQVPRPRLDTVEENDIDDSHPIEDTTEVEHKSRRIVLNELLDKMSKK